MNLIAKEFLASKTENKGVLILSEMAGACKELGESLIVNPNNTEEVANTIKNSLDMKEDAQVESNSLMRNRLKRYDVTRWAEDFMVKLSEIKELQKTYAIKKISGKHRDKLVADYNNADSRILFIDYDGTLIETPKEADGAAPDNELTDILKKLSSDPKNTIVLISGRHKEILDKWMKGFNITLVAEHGVLYRKPGKEWKLIEPLQDKWKEEIKPILELYVDRTPGSNIEEKEYSLVWHYRKAEPELRSVRSWELREDLLNLTENLSLEIIEGTNSIEIKNSGINKGNTATHLMKKNDYNFILGMGDDFTDEVLFDALPKEAYTIKVGFNPSHAKYNLESVDEVRSLIKKII